ncbi:hypothetical protein ACSBR2_019452 [Camellia fascicularis]
MYTRSNTYIHIFIYLHNLSLSLSLSLSRARTHTHSLEVFGSADSTTSRRSGGVCLRGFGVLRLLRSVRSEV